jgi:hypothetical protein
VNADLSWVAGGATSYDVYFGIANPPPLQGNQLDTSFNPGTMNKTTEYFWRINAINPFGTTTGNVWSFTTESVQADFDGDGDVDQDDFGHFQACLSGSGFAPQSGCDDADLEGDNDVDEFDFNIFEGCMNGAEQSPGC